MGRKVRLQLNYRVMLRGAFVREEWNGELRDGWGETRWKGGLRGKVRAEWNGGWIAG